MWCRDPRSRPVSGWACRIVRDPLSLAVPSRPVPGRDLPRRAVPSRLVPCRVPAPCMLGRAVACGADTHRVAPCGVAVACGLRGGELSRAGCDGGTRRALQRGGAGWARATPPQSRPAFEWRPDQDEIRQFPSPPPRSPHRSAELSTAGDRSVSYTRVIIPTVEGPVENSGAGVGTTVWRTYGSVENGVEPPDRDALAPVACGQSRPELVLARTTPARS